MLEAVIAPLLVLGVGGLLALARRLAPKVADAGGVVVLVALTASLELGMGRVPAYAHGPMRLWSGDVQSDQNSQQIADPYSLTHVVHGAGLYGLARLALGARPVGLRLLAAIAIEAAWEVLENTDAVIERYREETISLDYYGDSVVNSVADVLFCLAGFLLAWTLPVPITLCGAIALELLLLVWIRDNLTLNVLMLLYPLRAIRDWQLGP